MITFFLVITKYKIVKMTLKGFSCILSQDIIYGSASKCDGFFQSHNTNIIKIRWYLKNPAYEVWSSVYNNKMAVLNIVPDNYMQEILQIVPNWGKINLFTLFLYVFRIQIWSLKVNESLFVTVSVYTRNSEYY